MRSVAGESAVLHQSPEKLPVSPSIDRLGRSVALGMGPFLFSAVSWHARESGLLIRLFKKNREILFFLH